jgi:tetratricopeptide (TPR) repeat protein
MRRSLFVAILLCWSTHLARSQTYLVLPFFNETSPDYAASSNLDWISESIARSIREGLASAGMLVLERDDILEAYRRLSIRPNARLTHASVIKVAEALDATEVIYGEFEYTPAAGAEGGPRGTLRIAAHTIDTQHMRKGPDFTESGALEELAKLQSHLAWQTLDALAPDLAPPAERFMQEQTPIRLDALENYIRGLLAASADQKHRYFTQAVRLDGHFSQPDFELGRLYWDKKEYRLAADWLARVSPSSQRYLEANFLLGLCRYYTGDYAGAQTAFELVVQSVPLNEVYNDLGAAQSRRGEPGALASFQKALEGDPSDADYEFNVGYALWKSGDFTRAAEHFRAVLDRKPDDDAATLLLGRCIARRGPRPMDPKTEPFERLKLNYEEGAYRQLKAALESRKGK